MASHRPEYETSMKMRDRGKGKEETSISWKFSLKKKSFVHRVKIFERKKNKFQTRGSIISIPVLRFFYSVSLFHIRRMNYRKEESNIGEPSITGLLNKDVANTFTNLLPLYSAIFKRGMEYLFYLFGKATISHTSVYPWITWNRFKHALLITYAFVGFWDFFWSCPPGSEKILTVLNQLYVSRNSYTTNKISINQSFIYQHWY